MEPINIAPCGSVQLGGTVNEPWRTLRRLLEAAFKPMEKSKPFVRKRKSFALSWAWEHTLCLPYKQIFSWFSFLPPSPMVPRSLPSLWDVARETRHLQGQSESVPPCACVRFGL